jgi:hypothetical protein
MGYNSTINNEGAISGGQGNTEAWDIITAASHDLGGRIVGAFWCVDTNGGTFSEMEEQTSRARGNIAAVSAAVAAKYLTYTYPQNQLFTGRYTKLVPATGTFIVYFLK